MEKRIETSERMLLTEVNDENLKKLFEMCRKMQVAHASIHIIEKGSSAEIEECEQNSETTTKSMDRVRIPSSVSNNITGTKVDVYDCNSQEGFVDRCPED